MERAMFGILDFLWKNSERPVSRETAKSINETGSHQESAYGTLLHYDPNLVPSLIADHQKLVGIFGEVGNALKQKNSVLLKENLAIFSDTLREHLSAENIKFYAYLQHSLENDVENAIIMLDFRKEMQQIGKAVADFLHKYEGTEFWVDGVWQDFENDVRQIGEVLVKRIQTEEKVLYALYLPTGEYT
jgi:regulator of sigma D